MLCKSCRQAQSEMFENLKAVGVGEYIQQMKYKGIFLFWIDNCGVLRDAGLMLFFRECYW